MRSPSSQSGFSMIEMLMAAFILAIGILGLSMLQIMSLQSVRGGQSLQTAVQVAEQVLDRIEMEGRLAWLDKTSSDYTASSGMTAQYMYIGKAPVSQSFNTLGTITNASSANPLLQTAFFTVSVLQGVDIAAGNGKIADFTVIVTFADQVDKSTGLAKQRTVNLSRRVLYG